MLKLAHRIEKGDLGQDQIAIDHHHNHWIIVVADGAGGTGGSTQAAQAVCDGVLAEFNTHTGTSKDTRWGAFLLDLDRKMPRICDGGQTTAVVIDINNGLITGASVGDSQAWLVTDTTTLDLTLHQQRQPLLGSGEANPIGLRSIYMNGQNPGRLLVGSDGLFKYAQPGSIASLARSSDLGNAVNNLVDSVRLKNGALPDDVAVVLCEEC